MIRPEVQIFIDKLNAIEQRYPCILIDNPWHHVSRSAKGQNRRSPSFHYPTMSIEELCALPIKRLCARDAHVFIWTTQPHLEVAFAVMKAWGIRYSSVYKFWVKLPPRAADQLFLEMRDFSKGMGRTTRKNVEPILLGRVGSPKRLVKGQGDLIIAARRQHSRKPDASYSEIEAYCPGPRLELFARERRPGWDVVGNDVDKFSAPRAEVGIPTSADIRFGPPWPWPTTPLLDHQEAL